MVSSQVVLLVEDDDSLAEEVIVALEASGHVVRHVGTMEGALEAARRGGINCVVHDPSVPLDDDALEANPDVGLASIRALDELPESFPIVVLSGQAPHHPLVQAAFAAGADTHVSSLDLDRVTDVVGSLGERRSLNALFPRRRRKGS